MTSGKQLNHNDNYFTALRLCLAAIVAIWHGFAVLNAQPVEFGLAGLSPSQLAVNGFFILSGFFIAGSLDRRGASVGYAVSRVLRLYPALMLLLAAGAGLALLAGGGASADWLYPVKALLFLDAAGGFPGLFETHPWQAWSIPLWTLRYEAIAYVIAPLAFLTGMRGPRALGALLGFFMLGHVALGVTGEGPAALVQLFRLMSAFFLGALIYALRDRLEAGPSRLAGALILCALAWNTPAFELAANLILAWTLFALGFAQGGPRALSRLPDWSYGVYIWHWPVYQLILAAQPEAGPAMILALGLPLTVTIAALSWRYVERPCLALKAPLGLWIERSLARSLSGAKALIFQR